MEKYAAIILAAGKGTRMNNGEESQIPKVMYRLSGEPIIYYSVKLIHDADITKVVLVVGYKRETIEDYFGKSVEYVVQEQQLGTGHAALQAKEKLEGKSAAVIVFYGDNPLYKPETIQKLISLYEQEKPTVAMLSVNFDDPIYWVFGRIIRDEKGEVTGIIEQKDCDEAQLKIKESNPGFYIFDSSWLWANIDKLQANNAQHEYYLTDLISLAKSQDKKIIAMPVSGEAEALGINTQEQLKQAEEILRQRHS